MHSLDADERFRCLSISLKGDGSRSKCGTPNPLSVHTVFTGARLSHPRHETSRPPVSEVIGNNLHMAFNPGDDRQLVYSTARDVEVEI